MLKPNILAGIKNYTNGAFKITIYLITPSRGFMLGGFKMIYSTFLFAGQ